MRLNILYFIVGAICSAVFILAAPAPSSQLYKKLHHGFSPATDGAQDRAYWVSLATKIAGPVLSSLSEGKLRQSLPQHSWEKGRIVYSPQEAFARTLAGIAPWLELGPDETQEGRIREKFITMAVRALSNATNPQSPDYMDFSVPGQPLVEAAYISLALLRAPKQLWERLTPAEQANVINALKSSRATTPPANNWLMFAAAVEAALWEFTGEYQKDRLVRAIEWHMQWYMGDGTYGDGAYFSWDYYNSYVIHPFLLEVLRVLHEKEDPLGSLYTKEIGRAQRYATVLERLISPEGTFPVLGRSSAYRIAAFQALGQVVLNGQAPDILSNGSTRSALTAVMHHMMDAPGTFDAEGWLQIGAVGYQPNMREFYTSTGSLYICMAAFLPLGLSPEAPFWSQPPAPWTQKRIWNGNPEKADRAYREKNL